jgi:hypothetical protein
MLLTHVLLKRCLRVSLYSLLLGTALLALFFFANDLMVAFISVPVILVIGLYNLKLLLQLVWRGFGEVGSRMKFWITGLIMSLNIPVTLLYTKAVFKLNDTLLVRLVNDTSQPMHHLVVLGCGAQRPLADLQPGQATVLWLPIGHNCFERAVLVQYTAGQATQQALIDGYVVEGRRINVKLGSGQQLAVTALKL